MYASWTCIESLANTELLLFLQMTFAICLQIPNHRRFGRNYAILAEFLPQILFMECIFGYLVLTVIYKWSVDWAAAGAEAPSLLNMLIVSSAIRVLQRESKSFAENTLAYAPVHVPFAWHHHYAALCWTGLHSDGLVARCSCLRTMDAVHEAVHSLEET